MAYHHISSLYDYLMKQAPYDKWIDFSTTIFNKYGNRIRNIIDLGCGTGEITVRLAQKGYELFGVDYSSDMLAYAEQKAFANNLPIQWYHEDLRELDGFTNLDAAISFCDVIKYITLEKEIKNVFERVYRLLNDNGLFVFDVHSMGYVQNYLMDETFAEVTDGISY